MDGQATLLDVVRDTSGGFASEILDGVGTAAPEFDLVPTRSVDGMTFTGNVIAEYPSGGFRERGAGRKSSKGRLEPRTFNTHVYNPSWSGEMSILEAHSDGPAGYMSEQALMHNIGAAKDFGRVMYYGNPKSKDADLKVFAGLHELAGFSIDATGEVADGDTLTTVFAVKLGTMGIEFVLGNGGTMYTSDPREQIFRDSTSKLETTELHQEMRAYVGLKTTSPSAIGRIANISNKSDDSKLFTDDMASDLLSLFPSGFEPDVWLMHKRAGYLLSKSRQAETTTGQRVELPKSLADLPIVYTDSIARKESLVTGI